MHAVKTERNTNKLFCSREKRKKYFYKHLQPTPFLRYLRFCMRSCVRSASFIEWPQANIVACLVRRWDIRITDVCVFESVAVWVFWRIEMHRNHSEKKKEIKCGPNSNMKLISKMKMKAKIPISSASHTHTHTLTLHTERIHSLYFKPFPKRSNFTRRRISVCPPCRPHSHKSLSIACQI